MERKIEIYTDGASRGNPGPGGYGTILLFCESNSKVLSRKELSQGFRKTTNNRMELLSVIVGIEAVKSKSYPITIYSDSKYVVDSINKDWVLGWMKTGFKGKKNKDLWLRYMEISKGYDINIQWVKGHNGHPMNERCDQLAVEAALGNDHLVDVGYESSVNEALNLD